MRVYYAHHVWKYNTGIETYEIGLIKNRFPSAEIVNPNGYIEQGNPTEKIMKDCIEEVENCDALVFSTISGVVGKGLVREVERAQQKLIPILEIKNNELVVADAIAFIKTNSSSNRTYAITDRSKEVTI